MHNEAYLPAAVRRYRKKLHAYYALHNEADVYYILTNKEAQEEVSCMMV